MYDLISLFDVILYLFNVSFVHIALAKTKNRPTISKDNSKSTAFLINLFAQLLFLWIVS